MQFIRCLCRRYFNPRPRKEGDLSSLNKRDEDEHFNPRPRKEGDTLAKPIGSINHYFNPRPRKEGDATIRVGCTLQTLFQSTPS